MMGKQKFTDAEFPKLLRDVVNISFRNNTIGVQNPNELERVYGRASVAIYKEEIKDARNLFLTYLKDIYIQDDSFKNDFKNKQINTNKYNSLAKYILSKLEVQYGGVEPILTNKNLTIEHILPENPNDEWAPEFKNVEIGDYIFRIGNLTFLESGKNKEADRKSFEEKQKIYSMSNFKLTKEQIEYSVWNVTSLASRQTDMANKEATIWKINYQ